MNWIRIREIVRKEFIQLFRDRKNRSLLVVMPFVQLLIFGYVISTDVRDIKVGLLDQSRTKESRLVSDYLQGSPIFRITYRVNDPRELEELLLRRKVDIAIKIGPDFSDRIRKGETAAIQVLADGSMSNLAGVRIAYTLQVLERLNQEFLLQLVPQRIDYGRIDARVRTWYNPNLESRDFFVPGIVAVLIMIISLLFTSMAIIKEKEVGTMEQLIVTPMRSFELILGKTIPYILISLAQMVAVSLFAVFWFDIPMRGSVMLMFLGVCLFLLSTLGIGLFVSTISATQQQAMMTTFFFIVPFFMLSGFVFPIENMPLVVQWMTYLDPLRYMIVIIRGLFLKGVGMNVLWPQYVALIIMGMVVFAGAVGRFRKRLD
ncbi:MAG TPA: ABC transporter permease [Syntrophales bacterium]|nr:ABC transporter permease [Syntrophales bacterium]